jgi:hypothetical protein
LFEIFVEQQNPILTYNSLPPITSLNFYFLAVFNELCLQRKLAVAKTVKRFPEKYGKQNYFTVAMLLLAKEPRSVVL